MSLLLAARPRFLRLVRTALAASAVGAAAACSSDSTSPDASVVGTYTLESYAGLAVPLVLFEQAGVARDELLDGSADLRADQTFTLDLRVRTTDLQTGTSTVASDPISGTYTVRGDAVTFGGSGDATFDGSQASASGTTLTFSGSQGALVFRR